MIAVKKRDSKQLVCVPGDQSDVNICHEDESGIISGRELRGESCYHRSVADEVAIDPKYLRFRNHTSYSSSKCDHDISESCFTRTCQSVPVCSARSYHWRDVVIDLSTRSVQDRRLLLFPKCMYQQLMPGCLCCFDALKWEIVILWRNANLIVYEKGGKCYRKVRRGQHTFLLEQKYKYKSLGPQVRQSVLSPWSTTLFSKTTVLPPGRWVWSLLSEPQISLCHTNLKSDSWLSY
jgi:hypothetical protein